MCKTSFYDYILYDEHRKVYYRFVKLGIESSPQDDLEKLSSFPPLVSIIIIDDNFRKVGEVELPKGKFLFSNAFVGEEGLYISNNHPSNPEMQDDKLSFTLFELVKE